MHSCGPDQLHGFEERLTTYIRNHLDLGEPERMARFPPVRTGGAP